MFTDKKASGDNNLLDLINPFQKSDEEDGLNFGKMFSLTYKQRIYLFGAFTLIGLLFSLFGTIMVFTANIKRFAIAYTFGSICMILATLFLFGPMKQIKGMFSSTHRALAVGVYFSMIIITLVVAFKLENGGLCILCLILQVITYLWYTITSIPGGQTICECFVKNSVGV